jgi:hypothetical protein
MQAYIYDIAILVENKKEIDKFIKIIDKWTIFNKIYVNYNNGMNEFNVIGDE